MSNGNTLIDKQTVTKLIAKTELSGAAWEKAYKDFLKELDALDKKSEESQRKKALALLKKTQSDLDKDLSKAKKAKDKNILEIGKKLSGLIDKESDRIAKLILDALDDDDDQEEDVDPNAIADAEREMAQLKALLNKAKRMELNFGVVIGSDETETKFTLHRKRAPKMLFSILKKTTKLRKGSYGKATLDSGVLTLQCIKDLPGGPTAAKKIKLNMKANRMPVKRVRILDAGGAAIGEDDPEEEDQKDPKGSPAGSASSSTGDSKETVDTAKDSGKLVARGSKGDRVEKFQKILKALGYYKKQIDGIFGSGTEAAVKEFQKADGKLKVDGIIGPKTTAALAAKAKEKAGGGDTGDNPQDPKTQPGPSQGGRSTASTGSKESTSTGNSKSVDAARTALKDLCKHAGQLSAEAGKELDALGKEIVDALDGHAAAKSVQRAMEKARQEIVDAVGERSDWYDTANRLAQNSGATAQDLRTLGSTVINTLSRSLTTLERAPLRRELLNTPFGSSIKFYQNLPAILRKDLGNLEKNLKATA